tara:strand:- start:2533 stop:2742 length:210 start_codon:yes stop_codon:yes gene_type:complete
MPDPKRKKVRTQVCKTNKKGVRKCKYKMVKRTPKQLKAYDAMMKVRKKSTSGYGPLSDLDVTSPGPIEK